MRKEKTTDPRSTKKQVEIFSDQEPKSKLETYSLLVEELVKDNPDKHKVRAYCIALKIPFSVDSNTQISSVFNKLQSFSRHVMNK